jgi:hypothetical protein
MAVYRVYDITTNALNSKILEAVGKTWWHTDAMEPMLIDFINLISTIRW